MREAVGGSLLLYLIIPIIIVFIVFIGFIMNYASAYRAANYVITQIENCQGQMRDCSELKDITETIRTKYSYVTEDRKTIKPCYYVNGNDTYVFRVTLPVSFELPLIGNFNPMRVKAETKSISNVPTKSLADFSKCPN